MRSRVMPSAVWPPAWTATRRSRYVAVHSTSKWFGSGSATTRPRSSNRHRRVCYGGRRPMRVLTSLEAFEAALAGAASDPVLFFKHSETCGMSLQAHEEMRELVADPEWPVPVYLVSVQTSRPVSNAMA